MTNIDDIIADLKTDDPMTGVLEVIETLENAQKRIEELISCLSEAVDLTEDVIAGDYKPDSFTTQPWRAALKQEQGETIDDLVERIKPR